MKVQTRATLEQKMLPIKNLQETADLVTFTAEILNGKLHFLCSDNSVEQNKKKQQQKNSNL